MVISTRIMQKLPSVPYALFENNAFQARYGLVIREAAQQSITLVDSLLSTDPILLGLLGLAATLFVLAPLMVVAIIAIAIPAALALISQGKISVASLAVLIPGVSILSGMLSSFIYQYRSLRESLLYAETLFDFLATSFDPSEPVPPLATAPRLEAIRLEEVS